MALQRKKLASGADSAPFYPTSIPYSCRFDSARSCYVSKTFGTPTANTTWSFSAWLKRGLLGAVVADILSATGGTNIAFSSDALVFRNAGSTVATSSPLFRDPAGHGHLFVVSNGTTVVAYWNGAQVLSYTGTLPLLNSAVAHNIGRNTGASEYFDGYLSDVYFIDGAALTPASFGQFSAQNPNVWVPKTPTGLTYGTNGFHLDFADASNLGNDVSGNNNDYASSGLATTDQMLDTPTNNYCTMTNERIRGITGLSTLSNGNLVATYGGAADVGNNGSFGVSSGKWYYECTITAAPASQQFIGLVANGGAAADGTFGYMPDGRKNINWSWTSYGAAYTTNDVVGVAFDATNDTLEFFKNNVSQGQITSAGLVSAIAAHGYILPSWWANTGATPAVKFNFGATGFTYTPPAGFKALCSANLPDPAIIDSSKGFDAKLYTGTGAAQNITSFNFQPDLVWIKNRTTTNAHVLVDSVRGATKRLSSCLTDAEATDAQGLTAFLSNGFSVGTSDAYNGSTNGMVSWCWKKDAKAGFDIVSYTGNGANRTIAHSLGVAPEMMIVKNRTNTGQNFTVYHKNLTSAVYALFLNTTGAQYSYATGWNSTAPTSSVFSVGTSGDTNGNTHSMIAYLFAGVEGFSKFGSYVGNGNADGPFVYCGFRPRWVLIKNISRNSTDWFLYDAVRPGYNPINVCLNANANTQEFAGGVYNIFDIVSNGFKLRGTDTAINQNGDTFIYAAFAEAPFKYSNSR